MLGHSAVLTREHPVPDRGNSASKSIHLTCARELQSHHYYLRNYSRLQSRIAR